MNSRKQDENKKQKLFWPIEFGIGMARYSILQKTFKGHVLHTEKQFDF